MSRASSLSQLVTDVIQKHERAASDRTTVFLILVDSLDYAMPMVAAMCATIQGRLFRASDPELQQPVPGTGDPVRRAAVAQALTGKPATARHVDLVDKPSGHLDAVFADPPSGTPSPGEQVVLAVARAVAHRDLDDHAFAVIAYSENLIDLPFRRAIWSLAIDQLNGAPHVGPRTIVFAVESTIDIDLHCQTGRGFDLALDGSRLLRRNSLDALRSEAGLIARHTRPLVFYLGAGFSASSRLPFGNTLRDSAIKRLLNIAPGPGVQSDDLAGRFHDWVANNGWLSPIEQPLTREEFVRQLTLEQVVRIEQLVDPELPTLKEFREHHDRVIGTPGQAVLDLMSVIERGVGRIVVVEVNFDMLVETHTKVPLKVFSSNDDFAGAPDHIRRYLAGTVTDVPLLKLHGTIEHPETCVIGAQQTELGVGPEKLEALRALIDDTDPRLWIYVGTTLRDLDLRPLLLGEDFARGVDERWVMPYVMESVEEFGAARLANWAAIPGRTTLQQRLVTETADAFCAAILEAWGT